MVRKARAHFVGAGVGVGGGEAAKTVEFDGFLGGGGVLGDCVD